MFCSRIPQHTLPTLFPYTTLFRSYARHGSAPSRRPTQPLLPPVPWEWLERATARTEEQAWGIRTSAWSRSEEHTSELQSRGHLVCRLLLEKKKKGLWISLVTIMVE